MYGLIGKMESHPGKRDKLLSILLESTAGMPGCLSYIIAKDPTDENGIWVTEVWVDESFHKASLQLPIVQQAIARAKPMIAGFSQYFTTEPVGGYNLPGKAGG